MNVRLFLLIAMTTLFVAIWSSDQQYQEMQMAALRGARPRTVERKVAADRSAAPKSPSFVATSPFAASSWIAPLIAVPSSQVASREPVVAPRVGSRVPAARATPAAVAPKRTVFVIVSFRRRSFRFDGSPSFGDLKPTQEAGAARSLEAELAELARWANRVGFEIDGQLCWMRWQMRRNARFAGRRVLALLSQQFDWRELVQTFAEGALGPLERHTKSAAVPRIDEER